MQSCLNYAELLASDCIALQPLAMIPALHCRSHVMNEALEVAFSHNDCEGRQLLMLHKLVVPHPYNVAHWNRSLYNICPHPSLEAMPKSWISISTPKFTIRWNSVLVVPTQLGKYSQLPVKYYCQLVFSWGLEMYKFRMNFYPIFLCCVGYHFFSQK